MAQEIFIAKPLIVPDNLAEMWDDRVGTRTGSNILGALAEAGELHDKDKHLTAIALSPLAHKVLDDGKVVQALSDPNMVGKQFSLERMSALVFAIMMAYLTGTIHFDEDGDANMGDIEDIPAITNMKKADVIQFANGKTMPMYEFLHRVNEMSAPDSIKESWEDLFKRTPFGFKPRSDDGVTYYKIALAAIMTGDALANKYAK